MSMTVFVKHGGKSRTVTLKLQKTDEIYKMFEILARREGIDIENLQLVYCGTLYRSNLPEARKQLECIVKNDKPTFYMIQRLPGGIFHT